MVRAAGLALDPAKLLLGGLALLIWEAGTEALNSLPFAVPLTDTGPLIQKRLGAAADRLLFDGWLTNGGATVTSLLIPVAALINPLLEIVRHGSSWPQLATAWTHLLWGLLVWSVFGGALCRMAAMQFAGRERLSVRAALRYAAHRLQDYLTAPLLPLAGLGCLLVFNALLGAAASWTGSAGEFVFSLLTGLVLLCGLLMALLFVSITVGWPLMLAAVSTEDSDGFDGLSRANGFLLDRPWRALLLSAFSLPVFLIAGYALQVLVDLTLELTAWSVTAVNPDSAMLAWFGEQTGDQNGPESVSGVIRRTWLAVPQVLVRGFGPAYFWCAATVGYFLLRQSDDGTPLDDVTIREASPESAAPVSEPKTE